MPGEPPASRETSTGGRISRNPMLGVRGLRRSRGRRTGNGRKKRGYSGCCRSPCCMILLNRRSPKPARVAERSGRCSALRGRRSVDRFFSDGNVALYRLLASSTDVAQRRRILKILADETAEMKNELRQPSSGNPRRGGGCEP